VADVPRVECPERGVVQAATPWSDPGSRFTALFERVVIDWLKEASVSVVARRLGLTRDSVDAHFSALAEAARASVEVVAMDM
jgi:transposase